MSKNYGMLFEETVKKIFGRPKTTIYFASYYDTNEYGFLSLTLTMCIYELNYNPERYCEEAKKFYKIMKRKHLKMGFQEEKQLNS